MAPDRIGFDRFIRLRWLDQTASLAGKLQDADSLRVQVLQYLADDIPGTVARKNTAIVLTRIWWRVPQSHESLRDEALAWFSTCCPEDRLVLHWGMTLLAYPLFAQVASTVGRLLKLQGTFRLAQLSQRISADWGHRSTLETALPRVVRSMVDWQVLEATEEKGGYRGSQAIKPANSDPLLWLLEALMQSHDRDQPLSDLLRSPSLFPFDITLTATQLTESERLQLYRQAQEMTMVYLLRENKAGLA